MKERVDATNRRGETPRFARERALAVGRLGRHGTRAGISERMDGYWKDRVALITGGSSGLGRTLAQCWAQSGLKIVVAGLELAGVNETVEQLRAAGAEALGLQADITQQADVDRIFAETQKQFGRLDVLVNNAGRTARGTVLQTTPEQFRQLLELNLVALVRCTLAAVPLLRETRGHIVNIGSLAAKSASRWTGAYPASKHAVAAYSQQLRLELGPEGIHTLLVCPGPVRRKDERLYPLQGLEGVPDRARRPGAGVEVAAIPPEWLADRILQYCKRRRAELVVPGKARLLFAISQLWPSLGDWIVIRKTGGNAP